MGKNDVKKVKKNLKIEPPVTPDSKKIDLTDDTKRDCKYDYSAIFSLKEEYIFVFGG
jgi:hypothetical protein